MLMVVGAFLMGWSLGVLTEKTARGDYNVSRSAQP